MRKRVETSHADLDEVPSRRAVRRVSDNPLFHRIKQAVSADFLSISSIVSAQGGQPDHYVLTDFPMAFLESYYAAGLMQGDPLARLRETTSEIVDDRTAFYACQPEPALVDLMERFGVANRTHVPVVDDGRKLGALGVCRREPFSGDEIEFLRWAAKPLHDTMMRRYFGAIWSRRFKLTRGEILCLDLASRGYNSEEISGQSKLSFETVNSYLKDAARKLGAANRVEAVVIAIKNGVIG